MAKGLTILSLVVAILLFLLFTLDLVVGIPFRKASVLMDMGMVISSLGLAIISWTTFREQK